MNEQKNMRISIHCILACLYFLLLPTTIAVNSAGNSFLKLATVPIAIYFVVMIIFSKQVLRFNAVHLLLCLYTFSTLITLFVNHEGSSIDTVIGYFLNAALYLCLTVVTYNRRELLLLENVQVFLLLVLVMITLFSNGSMFDRTTLEIFGQASDPNYFVGFFIFPLSVTLKKIVYSRYRILYIILFFLSLYCVFLSGSRGGLIAVVASITAFALIYPPKLKNKVLVLVAGCSFILLVWSILIPFLPENIIDRMSVSQVIETGGTGRWDIWKSMLKEIVDSPEKLLLGRGISAKHEIFIGGKWGGVVAPDQLIQVLYNQGVVGLIAFTLLTVGCLLRCIGRRKAVAVAIIGMMALSISLSFNPTTRTFWNLVAYAAFDFPNKEGHISVKSLKSPEED